MKPLAGVLAVLLCASARAQVRVESSLTRLSPVPLAAPGLPLSSPSPLSPSSLAAPALSPSLAAPIAPLPAAVAVPVAVPAAVPAAVPSAASALPSLAAPASGVGRSDDVLARARSLNAFWDGLGAADDDEPLFALDSDPRVLPDAAGRSQSPQAAPWLTTGDAKLAAALDAAVRLAKSTRSGRHALTEAERVLGAAGRNLPVKALALGRNWGEYDYLDGTLRLNKKLLEAGREAELAGTLVHELTHVAQHALGVPSNALEMEIEAHLTDLALAEELGIAPPAHTFARQALDALAQSPAKFVKLLQAAIPGSPFLGGGTLAEVRDQLESDLDELSSRRGPRAEKLRAIVTEDLRRLKTPAGRAAYEEFSRRVMDLLKRRSAAARG